MMTLKKSHAVSLEGGVWGRGRVVHVNCVVMIQCYPLMGIFIDIIFGGGGRNVRVSIRNARVVSGSPSEMPGCVRVSIRNARVVLEWFIYLSDFGWNVKCLALSEEWWRMRWQSAHHLTSD